MTRQSLLLAASVMTCSLFLSVEHSHARRLLSGAEIPDRFIFPNDPSVRSGFRTAKELMAHGTEKVSQHCYFLADAGSVGRVTLLALTYAALGHFPASVFKGAVSAQELRINVEDGRSVPELLVKYALRASGNDVAKATEVVRAAEQHDARCLREQVTFNRTQIDLYRKDSLLVQDAAGVWVLMKTPGSSTAPLITGRIDELKRMDFWANAAASEYALAYWLLNDRRQAAAPVAPKSQPKTSKPLPVPPAPVPQKPAASTLPGNAPADPAPPPTKVVEPNPIKAVQPDIQALLAQARQFCVAKAVPNCG